MNCGYSEIPETIEITATQSLGLTKYDSGDYPMRYHGSSSGGWLDQIALHSGTTI